MFMVANIKINKKNNNSTMLTLAASQELLISKMGARRFVTIIRKPTAVHRTYSNRLISPLV